MTQTLTIIILAWAVILFGMLLDNHYKTKDILSFIQALCGAALTFATIALAVSINFKYY